jgi:hypothetical protein
MITASRVHNVHFWYNKGKSQKRNRYNLWTNLQDMRKMYTIILLLHVCLESRAITLWRIFCQISFSYRDTSQIDGFHSFTHGSFVCLARVFPIGTIRVWQYSQGTGLHNSECFRTPSPTIFEEIRATRTHFTNIYRDQIRSWEATKVQKRSSFTPCSLV